MKRMFKSTISLLLVAALLLTPLAGTTTSAVGEISANDTAAKVENTDGGYSYGNYILLIYDPEYADRTDSYTDYSVLAKIYK